MSGRVLRFAALAAWCFYLPAADAPPFTYTPEIQAALDRISADSLRGNLSFLASDQLEGRATPSRGLDIAAEYIAAQFRRAGLEPAGDDAYFQTARFVQREAKPESFSFEFEAGGAATKVTKDDAAFAYPAAVDLTRVPVVKVNGDPIPEVAGKVVLMERFSCARWEAVRALKPSLVMALDPRGERIGDFGWTPRLIADDQAGFPPLLFVRNEALSGAGHVTVRVAMLPEKPTVLRNVVGVLRGSDPALQDTCVLVTAHYDHVGRKPGCTEGDCIYNGANDDASGTVSVIELANALTTLRRRPRRSIVFAAFFGEEEGGLGSRYYARHPVFPVAHTIGDVNLEHLGRTDSDTGPQLASATFTGFEYSDLPAFFQAAGRLTGVNVYNTPSSNDFFSRSDNLLLAEAGIPAHTVCVAYMFPDYHGLGDHWDKIDYANMAKVNRMLALGVLMMAESPRAPRWNENQPGTRTYVDAWKRQQAN